MFRLSKPFKCFTGFLICLEESLASSLGNGFLDDDADDDGGGCCDGSGEKQKELRSAPPYCFLLTGVGCSAGAGDPVWRG